MRNAKLPDWEQVLSAAARLQRILPEAILVSGTASKPFIPSQNKPVSYAASMKLQRLSSYATIQNVSK